MAPDENFIAISNLYDGFDLYSMSDREWMRVFRVDTRLNVPLPVLFIEGGAKLFTGSSCGQVTLFDIHTAEVVQKLNHDGIERLPSLQHRRLIWSFR